MQMLRRTVALLFMFALLAAGLAPEASRAQGGNYALDFRGSGFVKVEGMDLSGDEVSISAWVKPYRFPNTLHTIAGIERQGEAAALLRVGDVGIAPNRPQFAVRIGGRQVKVTADETLETGTWQHVTGSYDGRKMQIFIDGREVGMKRQSGAVAARGTFRVSKSFGGRPFYGVIDEVEAWRQGIYESFVRSNMSSGLSGGERKLEAYWRFDGGGGDTVMDHTGNGHRGTIMGADWTTSGAPLEGQRTTEAPGSERVTASGFILEFPEARYSYLQNGNAQFYFGKALLPTDRWRVKQMKDFLYHVQLPAWGNYFWKVNTSRRALYSVRGGTFGEYGGRSSEISIPVEPNGGSAQGFVMQIPSVVFAHTSNRTLLQARSRSGAATVLAEDAQWEVQRMNREIFQVRHRTWRDEYWQVNVRTREAHKVNGEFGAFGGTKDQLDAEVRPQESSVGKR
jgi:hypothetical protein